MTNMNSYTLDLAETNAFKLLTFEGRDDEDFAKFQDDVKEAFVQNRVPRSDKLDKLRDVLIGNAKKLVSQSITNKIDEAWDILEKAFGNPIRLINNRKDSPLKIPPEPADVEDELVSIIRAEGTTELDLQEVLSYPVHSSKNLRGRPVISTEGISVSSVVDMKKFKPKELKRRKIFSKMASLFDLTGKLTQVEVGKKRVKNFQFRSKLSDFFPTKFIQEKFARILSIVGKIIKTLRSRKSGTLKVDSKPQKVIVKLFDKKPTDDENDHEVIDVHRHRLAFLEFGVHEKIKPEDTDIPGTEEMFDDNKQGPRSQVFNDDEQGIGQRVLDFKETKLANVEELDYSSEDKLEDMEMDISGFEVFGDKHSKDEGLFNDKEYALEVRNLHDDYENVTEDSGKDEVLAEEGMEMKTTTECGLRESNSLDEEAKGEEPVQVKEVKSDLESPGTAPIVVNSDQKSLSPNQALKKLKKMNANVVKLEEGIATKNNTKELEVDVSRREVETFTNKKLETLLSDNPEKLEIFEEKALFKDDDFEEPINGKIKTNHNVEIVHNIAITLLPMYPFNTSWPKVTNCEDDEDYDSVVQLDPGGMVTNVIEVEILDEMGANAYDQVTKIVDEELIDAVGVTKAENAEKIEGITNKIEKAYSTFLKICNTTMIPKLMKIHKWYKSDDQLMVGDIIYFKKDESVLSSEWTVGRVTDVIVGKDGDVRRAILQFQNSNEKEPRFNDRAARSLVKLFNIEDSTWLDDMHTVERVVAALRKENGESEGELVNQVEQEVPSSQKRLQRGEGVQYRAVARVARKKIIKPCKTCCCVSHCLVTEHGPTTVPVVVNHYCYEKEHLFNYMPDRSWQGLEEYEEEMFSLAYKDNTLMSLICSVNLDLTDAVEDL